MEPFVNNRGSAILLVIVMLGAFMASYYAMMGSASRSAELQQKMLTLQQIDSEGQVMAAILSNPSTCFSGMDGSAGLQFQDSGGASSNVYNPTLANSVGGQSIDLPSPYFNGTNRLRYGVGALDVPNEKIQIRRVYIGNPNPTDDPTVIRVSVRADIQSTREGAIPARPRDLVDINIKLGAGNVMTACNFTNGTTSNQAVCNGMGCVYTPNPNGGGGNCECQLSAMTCPADRYVQSISGSTPVCSTNPLNLGCAATPNSFIVAFDSTGNVVCGIVDSCPMGTSATGVGGAVGATNCRCPIAGDLWQVATGTCATPINGVCGGTNGGSFLNSTDANNAILCASGNTVPAFLTDPGPWSWNCLGINGGADAPLCTASVQVVNGACGGASGGTFNNATEANNAILCAAGATVPAALVDPGPWTWNCNGTNGGANALCTASLVPAPAPAPVPVPGPGPSPLPGPTQATVPSSLTGDLTWEIQGVGFGTDGWFNYSSGTWDQSVNSGVTLDAYLNSICAGGSGAVKTTSISLDTPVLPTVADCDSIGQCLRYGAFNFSGQSNNYVVRCQ